MPRQEPFTLTELVFRAGRTPDGPPSSLQPAATTIFVGPNNSGKSQALRDLFAWSNQGQIPPQPWPGSVVLTAVHANWPTDDEALDEFLMDRSVEGPEDEQEMVRRIRSFVLDTPNSIGSSGFVAVGRAVIGDFSEYCRTQILPHLTARLDGRTRFALADPRQLTDLKAPATNYMMAIYRDADLYQRVSDEVFDTFGYHLVVDMTNPPNLMLSLSREPHPVGLRDGSTSESTVDYVAKALPLQSFSDGVQVYTGLVAALESLPQVLLLLDEPEAFLHPALARRLGRRLARSARDRNANLVAATHSAEFLMGCVEEDPKTSIVRLTFEQGQATARPLSGGDVEQLAADPLLRSTDALGALFSYGAVVCEADADRAVYEEINRRLIEADGRTGVGDVRFLNAQNWQTVSRIVRPLRELGVPAACIIDLDTLMNDDGWPNLLQAVCPAASERSQLGTERSAAGGLLRAAGELGTGDKKVAACKIKGIDALADPDERQNVVSTIDSLARYGLFVVPVGELENWLKSLGVTNKQTFVTGLLERLGSRGTPVYVEPGPGDIWDFIERVAEWILDPARDGMD